MCIIPPGTYEYDEYEQQITCPHVALGFGAGDLDELVGGIGMQRDTRLGGSSSCYKRAFSEDDAPGVYGTR